MLKRALVWGSAAAAGGAAWTLAEYAVGFHGERAEIGRYTGFVGLVFPIVAITLALRDARRKERGLTFARGVAEGASVTAVLAVLAVAFFAIYFGAINPGFLDVHGTSLAAQLGAVFASSLIFGLVVSVAAAALMRRSPAMR